MKLPAFKLERYFAEYEFNVQHLLSASDCESLALPELLALADTQTHALWERLWLGYTESDGHPLLREAIARQYESLEAGDVLVAAPEEAIFTFMNGVLEPGDEVVLTWPAYQSLATVAESIGCRVVRWPVTAENGRWTLDVDALPRLMTPRTKVVVANFPHNPTGYLPSPAEWAAIVDTVSRSGAILFSDEMYRGLEMPGVERLPSACDCAARGVTLSGLSKSYGLPGLRIGWLATHDRDVLRRTGGIKDYTTICSSAPSEILGIIALRAGQTIVARNTGIVRHNCGLAEAFFGARPDAYEWLPPMAGSVAFPRLRLPMTALAYAQECLDTRGVMIAPGEMFEMPGHFRVGLGRRSFGEALAALGAAS
jgi:aspartate/methionine/tyrosine aminotransferase